MRTRQLLHTFHNGNLAVHLNLCTHAVQFIDIFEAVVPHPFSHDARSLCDGKQGGHLWLHIGGEAGMRQGLNIGLDKLSSAAHQNGIIVFFNFTTSLNQLVGDCLQMFWNDVFDEDLSAGGSGHGHIGAGFDLVRDDWIGRAVHQIDPVNLDDIGAGSADVRTHGV